MTYQPVQIVVRGSFNVELSLADVVGGFIVHHESTVHIVESAVSGQDGIVRLYHGGGDTWGGVDDEAWGRRIGEV